jgi:hypothetical protein
MAPHCQERASVILRFEQRYLTSDELGVLPRTPPLPSERHLRFDGCDGVRAVDAYPVGIRGVVTGPACEVALGEHPMGALASGGATAEELRRNLRARR